MSRRYRIYSRASNGVDAAVDSVLYTLVTWTAPIWVPVAAVYIGWLAWQEWRGQQPTAVEYPALTPLILCRGFEAHITSPDLVLRRRSLESYEQFNCSDVIWKASQR
jgi:hypothetical protein